MEKEFWQTRWRNNQIGFHEAEANALLLAHFDQLHLSSGDRVFVPLCGKTHDLDWLMGQKLCVTGVEFNQGAAEEVFERLNLSPDVQTVGTLLHYSAPSLDIFVGDFFDLSQEMLGKVDAIYDRAALVALPLALRNRYARRLVELTHAARQLLVTFEYDQQRMEGPPFSVPDADLRDIYADHYNIDLLAQAPVAGPLAQRSGADEKTWLLSPK
ncbi:MAG: thiopurine S-methyltransferase [Marinosulfonomonas sp.]